MQSEFAEQLAENDRKLNDAKREYTKAGMFFTSRLTHVQLKQVNQVGLSSSKGRQCLLIVVKFMIGILSYFSLFFD